MKYKFTILALLMPLLGMAQVNVSPLAIGAQQLKAWDTEINLDTIDQEKLPQRVTGGLIATANISNFIIRQNQNWFSSYMKVGADLGGFVDFTVTKHFAIQGRLMLTAEQNRFADTDAQNLLWAFGFDIPVMFLARFGNLQKGYLSVGGGPFTHFNYASNIGKKGAEVYSLSNNHSGIGATLTYEFPIGIQVVANYFVSLTDIISFHKKNAAAGNVQGIYPQRVELGIAYRWQNYHTIAK
ncbi:MAG: hypothetical protein IJQ97_05935 [Paludibacteraceae bacterium]|nr:hypothetical protein [Paludibacteraceae bacterium]